MIQLDGEQKETRRIYHFAKGDFPQRESPGLLFAKKECLGNDGEESNALGGTGLVKVLLCLTPVP
jgi:hypothetical protein